MFSTSFGLQTSFSRRSEMSTIREPYNWIVAVYRLLTMSVGIPGNCLILMVYWNKTMFGSAQVFIQALALCDLFACLSMPLEAYYWLYEFNFRSNLLCKVFFTWCSIGWYLSAFLTAAIAWDRYLVVCKPFSRRWSRSRANMVCIFCLTLAITVNSLAPFSSGTIENETFLDGRQYNVSVCYQYGEDIGSVIFILATVPQYVAFLIVFVILIALYLKLWLNFRSHHQRTAVSDSGAQGEATATGTAGRHSRSATRSSKVSSLGSRLDRGTNGYSSGDVPVLSPPKSLFAPNSRLTPTPTPMRSENEDSRERWCYNSPYKLPSIGDNRTLPSEVPVRRGRENGRQSSGGESWRLISRMSKMLFLATFIFVITWTITLVAYAFPPSTIGLSRNSAGYVVISLLRLTGLLNHTVNPIVYGFVNPKFRLDCYLLCKQLAPGWNRS